MLTMTTSSSTSSRRRSKPNRLIEDDGPSWSMPSANLRKRLFSEMHSDDASIINDSQPDYESQDPSIHNTEDNSHVHSENIHEPLPDALPRPREVRNYKLGLLLQSPAHSATFQLHWMG